MSPAADAAVKVHRPAGRLAAAAAAAVLAAGAARADDAFVQAVRADTERLCRFPSRVVGSPGHDRAIGELLAEIRAIPGVRAWTRQFPVIVPRTIEAVLTVTAGEPRGPHRMFPLWPAGVRLHTTPASGIAGRLVYARQGRCEELPVADLPGQIAVMEFTGGLRWKDVWNAGAKAIVLLGSEGQRQRHARSHLSVLPICVPRFYVPAGPLADALRSGRAQAAHLYAKADWHTAQATNIWALVPPAGDAPPQRALAVGVQADAMGIVPELAPGADAAVDAALALNLLRRYAEHRPARPLLVAFFDAYGFAQLGVREMLMTLMATDKETRPLRADEAERIDEYSRHEALAASLEELPDPPADLHRPRYGALHAYVKDEVAREVVAIETVMHPKRLRLYSADDEQWRRLKQDVDAMAARRTSFFNAQQHLLSRAEAEPETAALARTLWQRARRRIRGQLAEARDRLESIRRRAELRRDLLAALGLAGQVERPIEFILAVDLSDAGLAAGPMAYCRFSLTDETANSMPFRRWLSEAVRRGDPPLWPGELARAVNLKPLDGTERAASYTVGETATLTSCAANFSTCAATWATLDAPRPRADTPQDRADRLDWLRLGPQIRATCRLLDRMVRHTDFAVLSSPAPKWRRVEGFVVDRSPGEPVPRLPMHDYLTCLVLGTAGGGRAQPNTPPMPAVGGLRRLVFRRTGVDGRFVFDAVPVHERAEQNGFQFFCQSYQLAEDGRIARALDLRKAGKGVSLNVDVRASSPKPVRGVAFTCEELSAVQLLDPRFLLPLPLGTLFDARRGAEPQRLNFSLLDGELAAQVEPGMRWDLALRAGTTRNRMLLLNMADPAEPASRALSTRKAIRGFAAGERPPMHPMRMAAVDMCRLDRRRLDEYRRAGITSRAVEELQQRTRDLLARAEAAQRAGDGATLARAGSGALANEIRVYQAARDLANDTIRGAIFLLLVMVPFSFALERLLLATPRIYRQIAAMLGICAVMTAILWSFHPAFEISRQPLMILMAFAILFMSALVLSVVYTKFEASLEELRSGRAEAGGAQTSRFGVLVTAVRMGIANMRKRRLRTVLTGTTVVLITFCLMCFLSTSTYTGRRQYVLDAEAPYTGVLIRQPNCLPMPAAAELYLQDVLGRQGRVGWRHWWVHHAEPRWRLRVRNPATGRQVSMQAALALSADEARLTRPDEVLPNWPRFAERGGCYLPLQAAEEIGAGPGATVVIAGRELELIGVYRPAAFDARARGMDGRSILPINLAALTGESRNLLNRMDIDVLANEIEAGRGLQDDLHLPPLSSRSVAVVSPDVLAGLPRAALRSVAVGTDTAEQAEKLAMELTRRFAFPIYYGSPGGGVRAVVSTPMFPAAPKRLLIPLLIGGLIIFNTMLSSIAERRRDVYVYASMGLAPMHVAALFLAEAATYGLMGSVFGYIAGQGVATALSGLGWLGGLTLNYSGTHAAAVMLMVLAVVTLSSVVPAYLAGRLASPSSERTWKVPAPDGDTIRDTLPFTVTERTAGGVIMFLFEYLDAHREGGIGHFSVDDLRAFRAPADAAPATGIRGTVWLAPYDLGVRQDVLLIIQPTDAEGILGIRIEMTRQSGSMRSFKGLNRPFIRELRKQLLGWRKLKPQRILTYIAEGRELLGAAHDPTD